MIDTIIINLLPDVTEKKIRRMSCSEASAVTSELIIMALRNPFLLLSLAISR